MRCMRGRGSVMLFDEKERTGEGVCGILKQ
jgi:hypothetical protein